MAEVDSEKQNSDLIGRLQRAVGAVADLGADFNHHQRRLADLADRVAEGRFHLAVLGQFKRGKSTLLNALVGEDILPVGVVPLTAAPTFIEYGPRPGVRVNYCDERPAEELADAATARAREFLAEFVTEAANPENRRGVAEVHVELPAPILSGKVVLIDTPGIGSTYRHNTLATLNFLENCDAALFLVSADPPITEVELEFLRQVRRKVPRLFFVLNKIDYLDARELEEALAFYRRVLCEQAECDPDHPVYCVSARRGLESRLAGDLAAWKESGMERLESFLVDFLARRKLDALGDAVSRRALDLIDAVCMEAGIRIEALKMPRQTLSQKIALFKKSLEQAGRERRLIQDVLEGDKRRMTAFLEEKSLVLRQDAEAFLKDVMHRGAGSQVFGKSTRAHIQDAWAEAIPEFFEQARVDLNDQVKERLVDCLAPHEQRLAELVETLRRAAADLFQVPYRPLGSDDALEIRRKPYWVLNTWNTEALPMLKSTEQRLEDLTRRNVENIRWCMLQNLIVSFASFATRVKERLDETVAATKGAMEAARERRSAGQESVAQESARLGGIVAQLEKLKRELGKGAVSVNSPN